MKKILAIILILVAGWFIYVWFALGRDYIPADNTSTTTDSRAMSLEDYIKLNISELSTQAGYPEVLGGKFFVTEILAAEGSGLVRYEDGHNAYTANFTYSIAENGAITINSFEVNE
jgi:hypothetical protein